MRKLLRFPQIVLFLSVVIWPVGLLLTNNSFPSFPKRSIFYLDYQSKEEIRANTFLYPTVLTARVFQNKLNIPIHKFENNIYSFFDPNFYSFSSHPRELEGNQNLVKIPFVALIYVFLGLVMFKKIRHYKILGFSFLFVITTLSLLDNPDKFDLLLFPFFFITAFNGLKYLQEKDQRITWLVSFLLLFSTISEYVALLKKI